MAANGKAADGGLVLDAFEAVKADYQGLPSQAATIHLDPTLGDDSNDGQSWRRAKRSLQAALDAAPTGGQVLVYPGDIDLDGTKVTVAASKVLTIKGVRPVGTRQYGSSKQARILNTGTALDAYIETDQPDANAYGWNFEDLYFDASGLTDGGACIRMYGCSMSRFVNIGGRQVGTNDNRWVVKSSLSSNFPEASGGDHSWNHFEDCYLSGFGLYYSDDAQSNYNLFVGGVLHGDGTGIAVQLEGGSCPMFVGTEFETWDTAIKLTGCRNPQIRVAGESVDVIAHLIDCYDGVVDARSLAGTGDLNGVDEKTGTVTLAGGPNQWHGPIRVDIVADEGVPHRADLENYRGITPPHQLVTNKGAWAFYNTHPGLSDKPGPTLPHSHASVDGFLATGLTVEYYDGSAWQDWYAADSSESNTLLLDNAYTLTVDDAAHSRFRIRNATQMDINGILWTHMESYASTPPMWYIRLYDSSGGQVGDTITWQQGDPAEYMDTQTAQGFQCPVRGGVTVELECVGDFSSQPLYLARVGLQVAEHEKGTSLGARLLRSRISPEGTIHGSVGDECQVVAGTAVGRWVKTSGSNSTSGWQKLAVAS